MADEEDVLAYVWDPQSSQRCIVCGNASDGRAICADDRCAAELANG